MIIRNRNQDTVQNIEELDMGGEVRKMAVHVYDLNCCFPFYILLHILRNRHGDDGIITGLDDGAWSRDLVENVTMVAAEHGFGQWEGGFWSHSSHTLPYLLYWERVIPIHSHRGEVWNPFLKVGLYVCEYLLNLWALKPPVIVVIIQVPAVRKIINNDNLVPWML